LLRVLIAEDNRADAELIVRELRRAGYEPQWSRVDTELEYVARLHPDLDIILSDYAMPQFGGLRALALLHEHNLDVPFIIISGAIGEETAVAAIKQGASDYLLKDRLTRLGPAVDQALVQFQLRRERMRTSASLVESQHRLALATASAHIGIWDLDVVANKLVWDTRMYTLYGIRERDFSGAYDAWQNGLHPEDRKRAEAELTDALEGRKEFHTEFRVVWPDGNERNIEAHAAVQRAGNGVATRAIGVNWDITERKRADTSVRRLNRVYAVLSGINSLIVRARDRDELFREACRIAVDVGRFTMAWIGVVDRADMSIVPMACAGVEPEYLELFGDRFTLREPIPLAGGTKTARAVREKKAVVTNEIRGDTTIVLAKQRLGHRVLSMAILPLLVSGEAVGVFELYSGEGDFFDAEELDLLEELASHIGFAMDYIEKQKRLDYLAYYDVLTGLANRNLFLDRLADYMRAAAAGSHTLALVIIDLERFKNINDSLGQPAGDALLRQVAEWLTGNLPDAALIARVGADLFAAVLPRLERESDATRLLEKMLEAFMEHPFRMSDAAFRIAVKAGVVIFPEDGVTADTLFKNAEIALKKAKAGGSRYLRFAPTMSEALAGKLTLENQLRVALEKQQFVLHYQPKINLVSGELTGAEALIRWNKPGMGLVAPGQFVPLLEETGLILEVGRWALRKAMEDYLRWRAAGLAVVRVAVNVSPLQLRQRGFAVEIAQVIGVDDRASQGLELEITESLIMDDVEHSIASLQNIRAMGVTIAIDDFGTGFSSLYYLAKLPVDTLKIDRAFVTDMTSAPALVSTIINLAHSLKLKVVAEGVETEEQSSMLRFLSCDEMQGYLFGKPVPTGIFERKYLAPSSGQRKAG
jgi:diguanylate cyclase (GGDEF)-like protein/PAS domain S-box-containing protein